MADKVQEQLKIITEQLEQGIKDVFASGKYQEYLDVMSRFHRYSFNNTLLIAMQNPDATLVAGYDAWKRKFGRQVLKGERGISIIAPSPYKAVEEKGKINPVTKEPVLDAKGKPVMEKVEGTRMSFRVTKVFDVSQTEGRELPDMSLEELTGAVEHFDSFMEALAEVSPVSIEFEDIERDVYGYYHRGEKRIAVQVGLSEMQTMKTTIHETAHAFLHSHEAQGALEKKKDRLTMEVEAESIAYTVCKHYNLDTSLYSFGYIAGWSSDKEIPELRESLETIRKTSADIITGIDAKMQELVEKREIDKVVGDAKQSISFYVAEDGEFHTRGEYHDQLTLAEAIERYKEIPSERINAGKCIGFELHTGLEGVFAEVSMELFYFNRIGMDAVEHIDCIRGNELLWDAMRELAVAFPRAEIENRETLERLATDLNTFIADYDQQGYGDKDKNQEQNMTELKTMLEGEERFDIREVLQEVSEGQDGSDEMRKRAAELCQRVDDIYLRRDRNPLTKVEELEEENYNQIDGSLNNTHQDKEVPPSKGSVHKRLEDAKEVLGREQKDMPDKGVPERGMELVS